MGRRIEMEAEEKEYLIEECLAGRMRCREAARRAGVGHSTMHTWSSRYWAESVSALSENGNAQKRTYSEDIRQKAVEEYLSGQDSSMAIAEKYKLRSGNLVLDWVKEYDRRRKTSKEKGGHLWQGGNTPWRNGPGCQGTPGGWKELSELSTRYGITVQVVRNWVKRYQEMGVAGLEDRRGKRLASQTSRTVAEALWIENARLERKNYLLKMELDLLKK